MYCIYQILCSIFKISVCVYILQVDWTFHEFIILCIYLFSKNVGVLIMRNTFLSFDENGKAHCTLIIEK